MEIKKLDHVAIIAKDVEETKTWYMNTFEMTWVNQGLWENNPIFLKKGNAFIAIFNEPDKDKPVVNGRINHFAFRAETNTDYVEIKAALNRKNVHFVEQDHQVCKSIYMKDPNDVTVEITTYDV